MTKRVLVAGIGNIFNSDDGFGCEVARRLVERGVPDDVSAGDFGIRGIHLAYELLEGYEALVLVDATPQGGEPGTLYLIEIGADDVATGPADAHSMDPQQVIAQVRGLGRTDLRIVLVGCEPASLEEEIGLSPVVAAAVDGAVDAVLELVSDPGRLRPMASAGSPR
jgi:hydrogenase maturation protease